MRYGFFDDANREYVIERPDTPRPWSNYIGNIVYGGIVTNNAVGYSFYKSASQGRITRFRFNTINNNMTGKFVYLHDAENGDFWSNAWQPVGPPLKDFAYETRHGTGYTVITSTYRGITSQVTYFVPLDAIYETWKVAITNTTDRPRKIRAFPFIEHGCNWNALDDWNNLQYTQYIVKAEVVDGILDMGSNVNMPRDPEHFENKDQARHTFMGIAGAKPAGFDSDLERFIGPYGTYGKPSAVAAGQCSNSLVCGDNPCGAFQVDLELAPGQTAEFAVVFGIGDAGTEGRAAVSAMDTPQKVDAALAAVKAMNHARLDNLAVKTPDPIFNSMMNTWSPYNCMMTFYWSRTASMVYAGERDGLGFRDSMQDMLGAMPLDTDEAKSRLELLLTGQLANGGALPVVKPFAHRPGHEKEPPHYRADDCLWFFNAIPEYVKESGDIGFYRRVFPYADKGEATVLGHLRRAIEFNLERSGAHDLPCGLFADWNDCLRLGEEGESAFVAFQLRLALREYRDISAMLGEAEESAWAAEKLAWFDGVLEKHVWDGEWYLRAYRYDGLKFGSKENDEGSIFMNAQVWAVLSGHATGARATQAMDAMDKHLNTEYGVMLCAPPYVHADPQVALAVLFNPGMKENAGIFNHTQGWGVMAQAMLGRGDKAWEYMRNVLPGFYNDRAEVRQVEPYAVCQSTHARYSPRFGAGRLSWLSGAATWNYFAATQYILGVRPDYDGLRIAPCLPADWPEVSVTRTFRGKNFRITIVNGPTGHTVKTVTINGKSVDGNLIPAEMFQDDNDVRVELA
ncbi:MAG: N,N'-diacetylchitobiose phosphorylase [Myxococcales bacterium]|jgi:cellobiose phosphorylase|nr:N,N'-diacetylchitobiose phosphorylase [Myxococcales bacterium]